MIKIVGIQMTRLQITHVVCYAQMLYVKSLSAASLWRYQCSDSPVAIHVSTIVRVNVRAFSRRKCHACVIRIQDEIIK